MVVVARGWEQDRFGSECGSEDLFLFINKPIRSLLNFYAF
jgi:hypothetical protein